MFISLRQEIKMLYPINLSDTLKNGNFRRLVIAHPFQFLQQTLAVIQQCSISYSQLSIQL